ncbi:MAG: PstS family phosphate ABC transporter substrate-binding protein [Phycisphaerae bacterium]|nr:PstS family phosphate ABC transporter substrate-binding protein [Phycisphaerae bacterium]
MKNVTRRGYLTRGMTGAMIGLLALSSGCRRPSTDADSSMVQIKGSDTIVNANQKLSEEFMKVNPEIFVAVTGGGSGVGIASLINQSCNLAAASREMTAKEITMAQQRGVEPKEIVVAFDGIAVIVHPNNPVRRLTIGELHRIFTGKTTNWKEFGWKDLPIVTLSREVSSGTYAYFKEVVIHLGKTGDQTEFCPKTLMLSSSQAIVEETVSNEASIGYLGMGYVSDRTQSVEVAKDEATGYYLPTLAAVMSKQYPLARPLYFYSNGEPRGSTKLFVDYALSPSGQRQFVETGFVPLEQTNATKTQ